MDAHIHFSNAIDNDCTRQPLIRFDFEAEMQRSVICRTFQWWGRIASHYSLSIILISVAILAAGSAGLAHMNVESNPNTIWVPPGSTTAQQEGYFNAAFGRFFRIEQYIFTHKTDPGANIFHPKYLQELVDIQNKVATQSTSDGVTFDDLCFRPIEGKGCMIESPLNFFKSDETVINQLDDTLMQRYVACIAPNITTTQCLSKIGVPAMKNVVFGGLGCADTHYLKDLLVCGGCDTSASAMMITFLLNDDVARESEAERWEKEIFLKLGEEFSSSELQVSYMAGRSIQDAIAEVAHRNTYIVGISYFAMFMYIVFALGKFPHPVYTRAVLGFQGVILVAGSGGAAIGLVSYFSMPITMIVTEVVPFLLLAIGVDNMFIIVKAVDRYKLEHPGCSESTAVSHAIGEIGPTIMAAAFSECLAFGVGAATEIPALQSFCIVAAIAVIIDFFMQLTWFLSAVAIDARRTSALRYEICCCMRYRGSAVLSSGENTSSQESSYTPPTIDGAVPDSSSLRSAKAHYQASNGGGYTYSISPTDSLDEVNGGKAGGCMASVVEGEYARRCIRKVYAPIILSTPVRILVLLAWLGVLGGSLYGATTLHLGLEQQLVLPQNHYMQKYFNEQAEYGAAGPPAYIVLQNVDYTHPNITTKLVDIVNGMAQLTEYIEAPVYSWFADFQEFRRQSSSQCPTPLNATLYSFAEQLQQFLNISIDSTCCQDEGKCGAQYQMDVQMHYDEHGRPIDVLATRLRTQHTPLRNQLDFIAAMQHTQTAAKQLGQDLPLVKLDAEGRDIHGIKRAPMAPGGPAFAYSLFYVYYEQYNYIRGVAVQSILIALAAVFIAMVVVSVPFVAFTVTFLVACCTIGMVGWVAALNPSEPWSVHNHEFGVDINAVSVVNLITTVGLSVEFCVHITYAFLVARGTRKERAAAALELMGSNVVVGITLTKLLGVLVLGLAPSKMFRLYYFRMYMGIIVMGVFHGLAVLPALLSFFGPGHPAAEAETAENALVDEEHGDQDTYAGKTLPDQHAYEPRKPVHGKDSYAAAVGFHHAVNGDSGYGQQVTL